MSNLVPFPIPRAALFSALTANILNSAATGTSARNLLALNHNPAPQLAVFQPLLGWGIFNALADATLFVVAFSSILLIFRFRKYLALDWVAFAYIALLVGGLVNRALDAWQFSIQDLLTQLGLPQWFDILRITGSTASVVVLIGLPFALRRIHRIVRDIARSRKIEECLSAVGESSQASIFMYEAIRDSNDIPVDMRIIFLNRNAQKMIGVSIAQVIGKPIFEIFPDLRTKRMELYRRVIETGESEAVDFEHETLTAPDGTPLFVNLRVDRFGDGIVIVVNDISESERTRKELQRTLNYNKALILCSPFSIIATDLKGVITSVNPAAESMLQYSAAELVGQHAALVHDADEIAQRAREFSITHEAEVAPNLNVLRFMAEHGIKDNRGWTYIRKDGSRIPVDLSVTCLTDHAGAFIGFMGISYDLTERNRADELIRHMAHHDPLTGLPTRALLQDRLEVSIARAKRSQSLLALLMIDLDNFKRINDSLGHEGGDAVLCEIARRLKAGVRKSDTVARIGGDEFVVLLPDIHNPEDVKLIAHKLLALMSQPIRVGHHDIIMSGSFGISMFPDCEDTNDLLRNADLAMYRIKNQGRNGVQFFTANIRTETQQKLQMESALRVALRENAFEIVYQPQISFGDSRFNGVEALLRWHSPEFGFVPPNVFIPIAEETGLIVALGTWVLENACKQIAALQQEICQELSLAVNISPRQFANKDFPETVQRALKVSGLKPEQLELEITEQLLMVDSQESLEIMQQVRKLGVRFAIDDFGTGFSNMAYITRFAVDRIKIDRSFISKCDLDPNSKAVTAAIIALAHSLDIEVIAEGVETSSHVQTLLELSCDSAQGYLYSRPIKLHQLKTFCLAVGQLPVVSHERSGVRRAFWEIGESLSQAALPTPKPVQAINA